MSVIDWDTVNALKEFDHFIQLIAKGDRKAAFTLLKKINLNIVGQAYKKKYKAESKEMAIYNCALLIQESIKVEQDYRKILH